MISTRTLAERLLESFPFPGATPEALERLLERGVTQRLADGETLCSEGEPASSMFVLVRGDIKVLRGDTRGHMKVLATQSAPGLVGHMAMVDGSARSAACVASGAIEVIAFSQDTWDALMGETSPIGSVFRRLILSSLSLQLTEGNRHLRRLLAEGGPLASPGTEPPEDLTEQDVLEVAGILEGWRVDPRSVREARSLAASDTTAHRGYRDIPPKTR